MHSYYSKKLSGERLLRCYESASPRVKQYLEAEIEFVVSRIRPVDSILELGCGYGRVAFRLAEAASRVIGIDTSLESLMLADRLADSESPCDFIQMDASALAFRDRKFDVVVCVQNGICAFACNPDSLVREAMRVTKPYGRAIFSSYASEFWPERLRWFESQAGEGLVGEIDYEQTGAGKIVCKDGFRVGTFSSEDYCSLCNALSVEPLITTIDNSSVFCEMQVEDADL